MPLKLLASQWEFNFGLRLAVEEIIGFLGSLKQVDHRGKRRQGNIQMRICLSTASQKTREMNLPPHTYGQTMKAENDCLANNQEMTSMVMLKWLQKTWAEWH